MRSLRGRCEDRDKLGKEEDAHYEDHIEVQD